MRLVVGPGGATNIPCRRIDEEIPRDARPVHVKGRGRCGVQSAAMVDVLQMPPGRRTLLASTTHAEIPVSAVAEDDEAAPGHEVALIRNGLGTDRPTGESSREG